VLYGDGQLADLAPLLESPSVDDPHLRVQDTLLPGTVSAGTYGRSMFVLNYVYTVYGLWYSRALFERNGWPVPVTWAEFMDLAAEIKKAGIAPFAFQGKYPYYSLVPIMDLVAKNGGVEVQTAIDNLEPGAWRADAVRAAVEAVYELVARGYTLPGAAGMTHIEAQTAWCHGKAAWIPCGSWLENEELHSTPDGFRMAVAPMPALPGDRMPQRAVRAGAGEPFVVPARAANLAGGLEFLRLMASRAGAAAFARSAHSLTVVRDGLTPDVPLLPGTASADAVVRAAGSSIITWYFPDWYARLESELENATGELMAGRMTPDGWIAACQAAADRTARDKEIRKFTRPSRLV
jgi:N-acetylglucosamine transport system substrate-binding protein